MRNKLGSYLHLMMCGMLFMSLLFLSGCAKTCEVEGCNDEVRKPESESSKYCYVHTCLVDGCLNKVFFPPEDVEYTYGSGHDYYCEEHVEHFFDISNLKLIIKDSVATLSGTISNVSKQDYYQVFIKANFQTTDGLIKNSTYIAPFSAGDTTDFEITLKNVEEVTWARLFFDEVIVGTAGDNEWVKLKDCRSWTVKP